MLKGIIAITLSAVLLSGLFMTTIHGTNTTGWTAPEIAMWSFLGVAAVIGLVYGVLSVFGLV